MIVADTNILVRYLTNDEPRQARLAADLLDSSELIWLPKTVLLETEWVLRAVYGLKPDAILRGLLQVLGLPGVVPELAEEVALALDFYREGMDFADALHLASSQTVERFYTFDRNFVKAGKHAGIAVTRLE
jgi:predicted nucleic-acid-binding protein